MHKLNATYRSIIAWSLSLWMMTIIISGVVFMHKEVTSTGEIVTHIHPYDFTQKGKHHHHSDDEIQYLSVVFAGVFLPTTLQAFEFSIPPQLFRKHYATLTEGVFSNQLFHYHLRGPPSFFVS